MIRDNLITKFHLSYDLKFFLKDTFMEKILHLLQPYSNQQTLSWLWFMNSKIY